MGQRTPHSHANRGYPGRNYHSMTHRFLFTTAALPAREARAIVELICAASPEKAAMNRRNRIKRRFKNAFVRVLKFAKHETLRKLHRFMYSHRPIMGQDEEFDNPDSVKIVFDPADLQ